MHTASTPLAPSAAGILAALRADSASLAARSGTIACLHALIFACLARLLSRLGDLLDLWHAGQLPQPHAKNPTASRQPSKAPGRAPHPAMRPGVHRTAAHSAPHAAPGQTSAAQPMRSAPMGDHREGDGAPSPPPAIPIIAPPVCRHRAKPTSGCPPDGLIGRSTRQTMPPTHFLINAISK